MHVEVLRSEKMFTFYLEMRQQIGWIDWQICYKENIVKC